MKNCGFFNETGTPGDIFVGIFTFATIDGHDTSDADVSFSGYLLAAIDKIVGSIQAGKAVDRFVNNSGVITEVKDTFFDGNGGADFRTNLKRFTDQFGLSFEDVKDMSVAALIGKLLIEADDDGTTSSLKRIQRWLKSQGMLDQKVASLGLTAESGSKSKK